MGSGCRLEGGLPGVGVVGLVLGPCWAGWGWWVARGGRAIAVCRANWDPRLTHSAAPAPPSSRSRGTQARDSCATLQLGARRAARRAAGTAGGLGLHGGADTSGSGGEQDLGWWMDTQGQRPGRGKRLCKGVGQGGLPHVVTLAKAGWVQWASQSWEWRAGCCPSGYRVTLGECPAACLGPFLPRRQYRGRPERAGLDRSFTRDILGTQRAPNKYSFDVQTKWDQATVSSHLAPSPPPAGPGGWVPGAPCHRLQCSRRTHGRVHTGATLVHAHTLTGTCTATHIRVSTHT